MKKARYLALAVFVGVLLAACQPTTVEVTRVVTETETVTEQIEVTRVVAGESITEQVEVTRVVEVAGEPEVVTARGVGGELTVIYWQAPSTLNPYLSGGTKEYDSSSAIIEPLARFDENGTLVPFLASEIPTLANGGIAEDYMSITWKLRDGVLWSDGTPLTADDVRFTWEYCVHPDMGCVGSDYYAGVSDVEVVDDSTVTVHFESPTPYPYGPFVGSGAPVIQKAQFQDCLGAAAQECTEDNFAPIGTGPFRVVEFRPNDAVLYEANPNYRDPNKPYFATLYLKGGGDAASAARAVLETGEADYAWNLQVEPEILTQMELAGLGKVHSAFAHSVERLVINFTNPDPALGDNRSEYMDGNNPHPFLTNHAVRQALSMAIDRTTLTAIGYGPAGQPTCNKVTAPPSVVSTANDGCLVQDIDGANALLDEAGFVDTDGDGVRETPDGVPLKILYQTSTNSVRQGYQALIKQWWAEIGVDTELKNVDASVFFGSDPASPDTYGKLYADIEMYTSSPTGADWQSDLAGMRCSEVSGRDNNWLNSNNGRYCNPEFDALWEELTMTSDQAQRDEIVKELNDILMQDYALMPLTLRGSVSAWANSLLGVRLNSWGSELWNVADWTRSSN